MRRLYVVLISIFILLLVPSSIGASIATIKPDGEVLVNVLSDEDSALEIPKSESLKIKEVVGNDKNPSSIALVRAQDGIKLTVDNENTTETLDVTDVKDNVIEIEERPKVEKLSIKVDGDKFLLQQDNLKATTDYEIKIDPKIAGITLSTPSGFRFLSIFPKEAVATILRAKIINNVDGSIELSEGSDGVLSYLISGERVINFFDLYEHSIPVKARVSASTAEILSVEQPEWLRILGFLFV
ncbi:hypothetical protein JXA63_00230 [Candidatus Woesebacteria bacterium]|nr:hypothetical protein [Candidatus Woesebacteria bacterium]